MFLSKDHVIFNNIFNKKKKTQTIVTVFVSSNLVLSCIFYLFLNPNYETKQKKNIFSIILIINKKKSIK